MHTEPLGSYIVTYMSHFYYIANLNATNVRLGVDMIYIMCKTIIVDSRHPLTVLHLQMFNRLN
jgi:hypothetical protein